MNTAEQLQAEFVRQLAELQMDFKAPAYVRVSCEQHDVLKADKEALARFDLRAVVEPTWNGFQLVRRGSLLDGKLRDQRPKLHCIDLTKVE